MYFLGVGIQMDAINNAQPVTSCSSFCKNSTANKTAMEELPPTKLWLICKFISADDDPQVNMLS